MCGFLPRELLDAIRKMKEVFHLGTLLFSKCACPPMLCGGPRLRRPMYTSACPPK